MEVMAAATMATVAITAAYYPAFPPSLPLSLFLYVCLGGLLCVFSSSFSCWLGYGVNGMALGLAVW